MLTNFFIINAKAMSAQNTFSLQDGFLKDYAYTKDNIFSGIIGGTYKFDIKQFFKSVYLNALSELSGTKTAVAAILAVSFLLVVFGMTDRGMFNRQIQSTNPLKVFMLSTISVWLVNIINICTEKASFCILSIIKFMKISIPVYAGIGAFTGRISNSFYEYFFMISGGFLYGFIIKIVIPLIGYIAMLNIISSVFDMEFGKTAYKAVLSTLKTLLEILIALFAMLYSVWIALGRGATFAGIGAVKFAIAKFVPVAGGFLADSADGIAGAFTGIKASTGIACAVSVLLISYLPALYIGIYAIIAKILVIITSPLGQPNLTEILKTGDEALGMLFVLIVCIATLFVITVSILISGVF